MGRTISHLLRHRKGFSLIEVLMAMAITAMVTTGIYGVYSAQAKTFTTQELVVHAQQGLRLAMTLMPREVRMAGLSTLSGPDAGFTKADATEMSFSLDRDLDGDTEDAAEKITYKLDGGKLVRVIDDVATKILADNIEEVEFYYRTEGLLPGWSTSVSSTSFDDIRAVTITLLARTAQEDRNRSAPTTFTTPSGALWQFAGDGYRRRLLTTTVRCRNMGL